MLANTARCISGLWLFFFAVTVATAGNFKLHFDDAEAVKKLRTHSPVTLCADKKVAGKGSIAIESVLDGNGFKVNLPKNSTQGCVTFWLYDPIFSKKGHFRLGFNVYGTRMENGKRKHLCFGLDQARENSCWYMLHAADKNVSTNIMRHPGWTRFDIVDPKGKEPQHLLVYIDGRFAGKSLEKFSVLSALFFKSNWGHGTINLDEFSFNTDPNSFRPNAIQTITIGDEAGQVNLKAGEKLRFKLNLDQKGFQSLPAKVELMLLDGAERAAATGTVTITEKDIKAGFKSCELPGPSHSGRCWLMAEYSNKSLPLPDVCRQKIDVQYIRNDYANSANDTLVLAKLWDWLPVGPLMKRNQPVPTINTPNSVPADWGKAIPIQDVWYDGPAIFRFYDYLAGWYHRKVKIPAQWAGRKIKLHIDDPQTIATVFIDNKRAGEVVWPGGELDVTSKVKPGQELDLAIFVRAEVNVGYNKVLQEIIGKAYRPGSKKLGMRGLRGAVTFSSESTGARIDDVFVQTRVENKTNKLRLVFDFKNLVKGKEYELNSSVAAAGKQVLTLPAKAFTATAANQQISIETTWAKPIYWDIYSPFFYDLSASLSVNNKIVDVMAPQRFGFRDIKFEGRRVTINGRPLSLFHPGVIANFGNFGFASALEKKNLNFLSGEHMAYFIVPGRGRSAPSKHVEFCDNAGFGMFLTLANPSLTKTLISFNKGNDQRFWDTFKKIAGYAIKKYRNHPGVFFWDGPGAGNRFGLGAMFNPYLQDGQWTRDISADQFMKRLYQAGTRERNIIKAADPTRQIVAQDSGNFNDACHITQYAGFMPIQEVIEMNKYWLENGTKPFFYSEQAAPYASNWTNQPRGGGHGEKKLIPYEAEWCAITEGDKAFLRTSLDDKVLDKYEKLSKGRFDRIYRIKDKKKRQKALERYSNTCGPHFPTLALYAHDKTNLRNKVWADRLKEQFLNWRADGIGLLCPSYNYIGDQYDELLQQFLAPVTAFIAGPVEDRYDRTHIYKPGETLKRGIIILSNCSKAKELTCKWQLKLNGEKAITKTETVTIKPGATLHLPVDIKIKGNADTSGVLAMTLRDAKSGKIICRDEAKIDVLQPENAQIQGRIALIDPEGESAKALKKSGVRFQRLHFNSDLSKYEMIIFGRKAFSYELECTPNGIDLGKLTQQGKRILILEQSEDILRKRFKFRTEYISSRQVFGRCFGGTLLKGLPDNVLNYWRGNATLTDGYDVARQHLVPRPSEGNGGRWFYKWHDDKEHTRPMKWGNHHNVATVVVIKPDTDNFRPLIDCEFALNYVAAWELLNSKGIIVFNQLDVSGRTKVEPAAERFLANLVTYTRNAKLPMWRQTAYLGGEKGNALLQQLRIPFKEISSPDLSSPSKQVLVLGSVKPEQLSQWKQGLKRFVEAGGIVFSLPKDDKQFAANWTPFPVKVTKKTVNHSVVGKNADPLLAGIGNSDFYWKGNADIFAIEKMKEADLQLNSGVLTRVPQGKGAWIFCQIEPTVFEHKDYFWLKDSKRYTERLIRMLLTNLDVKMNPPYLLKLPKSKLQSLAVSELTGQWQCAPGSGEKPTAKPAAADWKKMTIPGDVHTTFPELPKQRGALWYQRQFELNNIPADATGARLILGAVKGIDFTMVNGEQIGHTSRITNPNDLSTASREYAIPLKLLKKGDNTVTIFAVYNTRASLSPGDGNLMPPAFIEFYREESGSNLKPVDLKGTWQGHVVKGDTKLPAKNSKGWHDINVPGEFEQQHADWGGHDGYFWYKTRFVVTTDIPSTAEPVLLMGGVDDEDDTYINGKKIGHTGADTNPRNYWMAERRYSFPASAIKMGENIITIRVNDLRGSGGINRGPVKLYFEDPVKAAKRKQAQSPYLYLLNKSDDPYVYQGW